MGHVKLTTVSWKFHYLYENPISKLSFSSCSKFGKFYGELKIYEMLNYTVGPE